MSIKQGLNRVAPIVDSFFVAGVLDPRVYGAFDVNVMEYADERGQKFAAPAPCKSQYDSHKPELQMWFFGIMLCEYVAGLLAKKVEEGTLQRAAEGTRSEALPEDQASASRHAQGVQGRPGEARARDR